MVDGASGIVLCFKFCQYLSNPFINPILHGFASVDKRIVFPKDIKEMKNKIDCNKQILTFPQYLHECDDLNKVIYHIKTELISCDDLKKIIEQVISIIIHFKVFYGLLFY